MTTDDIHKHLLMQDKNLSFAKRQVEELTTQVHDLKTLDAKWIDPNALQLSQTVYSAKRIREAFIKAKTYEGLDTNQFTTVLDTFIEFLDRHKQ